MLRRTHKIPPATCFNAGATRSASSSSTSSWNRRVPDFATISQGIVDTSVAKNAFDLIVQNVRRLGPTMSLGLHHSLIETLSNKLTDEQQSATTEEAVAVLAQTNPDFCRAMSVCLTSLEQSYHWPGDDQAVDGRHFSRTPSQITRLKFIVHHALHPELRASVLKKKTRDLFTAEQAIDNAMRLIDDHTNNSNNTDERHQRLVNLLFRTAHQDVFLQQSQRPTANNDKEEFDRATMEFGSLHEVVSTNGMMREMNEVFEQEFNTHKNNSNDKEDHPQQHLAGLQRIVLKLSRIMQSTRWDVGVWGATYLRFSKAVRPSTIDGTGVDTAAVHLLDACVGYDNAASGKLVQIKNTHRSYFPQEVIATIDALSTNSYRLGGQQRMNQFFVVCQQYYQMLEMHRRMALSVIIALRAGGIHSTAAGFESSSADVAAHVNMAIRESQAARFAFARRIAGSNSNHTANKNKQDDGLAALPPALNGARAFVRDPMFADRPHAGAVIRIELSASVEMMLVPGDRIRVSLDDDAQNDDDEAKERIFTVTASNPAESWLEVAVKNFTTSPLTNALMIATKSKPQLLNIRAAHTTRNQVAFCPNTTVFIAQGTAACGAIEWLSSQQQQQQLDATSKSNSSIKCLLICAARNWNAVPLKPQVAKLAPMIASGFLSVVFAMDGLADDEAEFEAEQRRVSAGVPGATVYRGRVGSFITSCNNSSVFSSWTTHGFVSGGSEFGVSVARALVAAGLTETSDRAGPILCPRAPQWCFDVYSSTAAATTTASTKIMAHIPRREVALHNKPNDAWIIVDGIVYDITALMLMHPGGQKVIIHIAGTDATQLFSAVHGAPSEVGRNCAMREAHGLLRACAIGQVEAVKDDEEAASIAALSALVEIQNAATNSSRSFVWPGVLTTANASTAASPPPIFFITNGLVQWARSLIDWEKKFIFSDSNEQGAQLLLDSVLQLDKATHALVEEWWKKAAAGSGSSDRASCDEILTVVFQRRARLWNELHNVFDVQLKEQIGIKVSREKVFKDFVSDAVQIVRRTTTQEENET